MKVKIQACITNEDGIFEPPKVVEVRDSIAHDWIKNKWAIDPAGKVVRMADGTLKIEPEAKATIETPESRMATVETADVKIAPTRRRAPK